MKYIIIMRPHSEAFADRFSNRTEMAEKEGNLKSQLVGHQFVSPSLCLIEVRSLSHLTIYTVIYLNSEIGVLTAI